VTALEKGVVSGERVTKLEKVATSYEDCQPGVEGIAGRHEARDPQAEQAPWEGRSRPSSHQVRRHLQVARVGVHAPICRSQRRRAS
jgi:hypothetical protein